MIPNKTEGQNTGEKTLGDKVASVRDEESAGKGVKEEQETKDIKPEKPKPMPLSKKMAKNGPKEDPEPDQKPPIQQNGVKRALPTRNRSQSPIPVKQPKPVTMTNGSNVTRVEPSVSSPSKVSISNGTVNGNGNSSPTVMIPANASKMFNGDIICHHGNEIYNISKWHLFMLPFYRQPLYSGEQKETGVLQGVATPEALLPRHQGIPQGNGILQNLRGNEIEISNLINKY